VFWTEPVLSALAAAGHDVTLESRVPELVQGGPWRTVPESRDATYDAVVDLDEAYERNPRTHVLHAYREKVYGAGTLDVGVTVRPPLLYLDERERRACEVYATRDPYVLFHARSLHYRRFRQVHGVDWGVVMDETARRAGVARLRDDHPDHVRYEVVNTPTLRATIPPIFGASLFVGLDAAPAHVAASLGVPAIVLFGSVDPDNRHLPGAQVAPLSGSCPHAGCYHAAVSPTLPACLIEDGPAAFCCTEYTAGLVLSRIVAVLDGQRCTGNVAGTDLCIKEGAWRDRTRRHREAVR